jgi:hypothetical protein
MRPLTLRWVGRTIAGEITRGVLTAIGGLIVVAILVLLVSFLISILF